MEKNMGHEMQAGIIEGVGDVGCEVGFLLLFWVSVS